MPDSEEVKQSRKIEKMFSSANSTTTNKHIQGKSTSFEYESALNFEDPSKEFHRETMPNNSNLHKGSGGSKEQIIDLEHFQSFPVILEDTKKERYKYPAIRINTEKLSTTIASSGTPSTPSTGSVGQHWKCSHMDIVGPPSSSPTGGKWKWKQAGGKKTRNVSTTSTTSYESVSSIATDISPYIHLIHSDSFVKHRRSADNEVCTKSSSSESRNVDRIDVVSDNNNFKEMMSKNILSTHTDDHPLIKSFENNGDESTKTNPFSFRRR